ncbi:HNH endonuclease [Vibrio phage D51]
MMSSRKLPKFTTEYSATKYKPGFKVESNNSGIGTVLGRSPTNAGRFIIKFDTTGTVKEFDRVALGNGAFYDPFAPTVCGIGFLGEGSYSRASHKKEYTLWSSMIDRCYSGRDSRKHYSDCSASKEWHNFQIFCKEVVDLPNYKLWKFTKHYELDKDILNRDARVYSKDTCQFVTVKENREEKTGMRYNK